MLPLDLFHRVAGVVQRGAASQDGLGRASPHLRRRLPASCSLTLDEVAGAVPPKLRKRSRPCES